MAVSLYSSYLYLFMSMGDLFSLLIHSLISSLNVLKFSFTCFIGVTHILSFSLCNIYILCVRACVCEKGIVFFTSFSICHWYIERLLNFLCNFVSYYFAGSVYQLWFLMEILEFLFILYHLKTLLLPISSNFSRFWSLSRCRL